MGKPARRFGLTRWATIGSLALACGVAEPLATDADDSGEGTIGDATQSRSESSQSDAGSWPSLADLPPDEVGPAYCARAAALWCDVLSCCSRAEQACHADVEEQCLESIQALHQVARVRLDADAADQCMSLLQNMARSCEVPEGELPDACARVWIGTSTPGQHCSNDISCAPQSDAAVKCDLDDSPSAGICITVPWLAEGEACGLQNDARCSSGLFCNDTTRRCEPSRSLGSPCTLASECLSAKCLTGTCVQESLDDVCRSLEP